jgi:hypothetical protein
MNYRKLPLILLSVTGLLVGLASASQTSDEAEAIAAAESWLALVDAGQYGKSWDESASPFRVAISKVDWEKALRATRAPLGGLSSRSVKGSEYTTSLPGAPDGEYVVIQFQTSFAKKATAVETVTPMKDEDGTWRVSGYYVK